MLSFSKVQSNQNQEKLQFGSLTSQGNSDLNSIQTRPWEESNKVQTHSSTISSLFFRLQVSSMAKAHQRPLSAFLFLIYFSSQAEGTNNFECRGGCQYLVPLVAICYILRRVCVQILIEENHLFLIRNENKQTNNMINSTGNLNKKLLFLCLPRRDSFLIKSEAFQIT